MLLKYNKLFPLPFKSVRLTIENHFQHLPYYVSPQITPVNYILFNRDPRVGGWFNAVLMILIIIIYIPCHYNTLTCSCLGTLETPLFFQYQNNSSRLLLPICIMFCGLP